jgi:hypothetical protein
MDNVFQETEPENGAAPGWRLALFSAGTGLRSGRRARAIFVRMVMNPGRTPEARGPHLRRRPGPGLGEPGQGSEPPGSSGRKRHCQPGHGP